MLDKIQLILSFEVLGFCVFGGVTLLLRARENLAKRILGWSMLLWGCLAIVRLSVNWFIQDRKEVLNPEVLITGCLVTACLACYVIELLRPGYLNWKRFLWFIAPVGVGGIAYVASRLEGGGVPIYYSIQDVFRNFDWDGFVRLLNLFITLGYMALPVYLVLRYSKEFTCYLRENVSDPEDYDLDWLRKIMIILSVMYIFYLILLITDSPLLYVIDKIIILFIWYYFFYKALFLKVIHLDHTFEAGWDLPYHSLNEESEANDEQQNALCKQYATEVTAWFEKEKPYLRGDLRLTDLQYVFPMSRSYLSRMFNKELGCSFSDYVNSFRIEESKRLLETEPTASIQEIAERSGFHSISTFRRAFVKCTGLIPSEYRKDKQAV